MSMIFIANGSRINQINFSKKMNNYHPNIKWRIEVNPSKFLDTEIMVKIV